MSIKLFITTMFLLLANASSSHAAGVSIEKWRGHTVLRLSGRIAEGTADEFAKLIDAVPPLPHGVPVLLLDSPGGLVEEALVISRLMDTHPFHVIVPDGARCASACASIIFVAGGYRTVEEHGLLGQHSCSLAGVPSQKCNDLLGQHAVAHGVPHGSVAAFVTDVAPDDILWFSREDAEGWGLTRYPGEVQSGFVASAPRVTRALTGEMPPAQAAWRLQFREDGYQAFSRTVSDVEREMQIGFFCTAKRPGRLFLSMEVNGPVSTLSDALVKIRVETDKFSWEDPAPVVWQEDERVSEMITEIPRQHLAEFLHDADALAFKVSLRSPFQPMVGETYLASSRSILEFVANHCVSGDPQSSRMPLQ